MRLGRPGRAIEVLEANLALIRSLDLDTSIMFEGTAGSLGEAYVRVGRVEEAIPLLKQVRQLAVDPRQPAQLLPGGRPARRGVPLGGTHGRRGTHRGGGRSLCSRSATSRPADQPGARPLRVLAGLDGRLPPPHTRPRGPTASVRRGAAAGRRVGDAPAREPASASASAACCDASADAEGARRVLTKAVEMLGDMGMDFWVPEAEQELAQVRREA